jgi:hypothetical protein
MGGATLEGRADGRPNLKGGLMGGAKLEGRADRRSRRRSRRRRSRRRRAWSKSRRGRGGAFGFYVALVSRATLAAAILI